MNMKLQKKKIKAVIFDMDGVVADTIPAHLKSWQQLFKEKFNVRLTKKYFFEYLNARQGPDTITRVTGLNIPYSERVRLTEIKDKYSKKFLRNIKPTPGLTDFLKFLKKNKIKTAIATSAQPHMMSFLLNKLKIKKYFDRIVTAKDIRHGKPHPDCYLLAAKKIKVRPQEAIVIEDAPLGINAAKAGKFYKAIGITNTQPASDLKHADLIIKNFRKNFLF
ncbi:MAG: HAD family phosphatase [Patescibacteria group bacterium]|jgi:beta-phosphoglucomutase family hydrolase